ncbi:MAG TPA: SgcJ/EcaC family oxidoreductase [Longimicrobiales bacterium]|nr:SgcJ/EcaC family oxidoreductase [Longimicrobiales bacterium]
MTQLARDEAVRQRNVEGVRAFFQSERELDLEAWSACWSEAAVRRTPFAPPGVPSEQRGREAIVAALRGAFEQALTLAMEEEIVPTTDPALVVARAKSRGELRSGVTYANELVAFFRFDEEGRIAEWTGYLNPLPILELVRGGGQSAPPAGPAAGDPSAAAAADPEAEAVAVYERLLAAWNDRSAEDFAGAFTPDGTVVGFDGSMMGGPNEIARTLGAIFRDHPTAAYVGSVREIRSLAPGWTLVRAVAGMVPPGADRLEPALHAVQSLVLAHDEGAWRIAHFQNTPAAFHGRPQLVEALTAELEALRREGRLVGRAPAAAPSAGPT